MGYTPKKPEKKNGNDLGIQCPFLSSELIQDCIQEKCGLWMVQQRACAINVIARKL